MIKLSIIIPVYMVQDYIDNCLKSCCSLMESNPSSVDYEIIIVNDGTPDNSMEIAYRYKNKYDNIIIVEKENGGLSSARNEGLKHAKGQYIWFVDSDDTITRDAVPTILSVADNDSSSDVFFFDINIIKEGTDCVSYKKMYCSKDSASHKGTFWAGRAVDMWPMAQMYVYKRSFLDANHLRFKEGILHEDVEFKFRVMLCANQVKYIPFSIYNYLIRSNGSISSDYSPKRLNDLNCIISEEIDLVKSLLDRNDKQAMAFCLYRNYESFLVFACQHLDETVKSIIGALSKEISPLMIDAIHYAPFRYKLKIALAFVSPFLLTRLLVDKNT